MPAELGHAGVLPGSMGSASFHVEGRGHEGSLCSSAHGAGRALSRTAARAKVTDREFRRQMRACGTTTACRRNCAMRLRVRRTSKQCFARSEIS
jgi:RNA-splicing ligase RtcB